MRQRRSCLAESPGPPPPEHRNRAIGIAERLAVLTGWITEMVRRQEASPGCGGGPFLARPQGQRPHG